MAKTHHLFEEWEKYLGRKLTEEERRDPKRLTKEIVAKAEKNKVLMEEYKAVLAMLPGLEPVGPARLVNRREPETYHKRNVHLMDGITQGLIDRMRGGRTRSEFLEGLIMSEASRRGVVLSDQEKEHILAWKRA